MKKNELKNIIKECVREVLFEEGVLSDVIIEVTAGLAKSQLLLSERAQPQAPAPQAPRANPEEEDLRRQEKLKETKRKMLDAIGHSSMKNIFEGTEPLSSSGAASPGPSNPMSGIAANDPGVDISNLFRLAGNKWKTLK